MRKSLLSISMLVVSISMIALLIGSCVATARTVPSHEAVAQNLLQDDSPAEKSRRTE